MFPPGRARLAAKPLPTGSPTLAKTIGIVRVALWSAAARAAGRRQRAARRWPRCLRQETRGGSSLDGLDARQYQHLSARRLLVENIVDFLADDLIDATRQHPGAASLGC